MKVEKYKDKNFVTVTREEALLLIQSLTNQLIQGDSNVGRLESYDDKGEYFSIFVLHYHFKSTREHTKWIKNGMPIIKDATQR